MFNFQTKGGFVKTTIAVALSSIYLAGCSSSDGSGLFDTPPSSSPSSSLSGVMLDPYIVYAKVWCDVDGNGRHDAASEPSVRTLGPADTADSTLFGTFTLTADDIDACGSATIYADGDAQTLHVDENGNKISGYTGRMTLGSSEGRVDSNVTPLINLKGLLISSGELEATAEANIKKVFGLSADTRDLDSIDFSDTTDPDNKKVIKAALLAQQLLNDITAALQGINGAPITPSSSAIVGAQLAAVVNQLAAADTPLIDATGEIQVALVSSALRQTMQNAASADPAYDGFDTDTMMDVIGDSVVSSAIKSASAAAEADNFSEMTQDLQTTQGSSTETLRVTMSAVKGLVDGSGDLDGDGTPDVAEGQDPATVASNIERMVSAVKAGLEEAGSQNLSDATDGNQIAEVINSTIGQQLVDAGLGDIATHVVEEAQASFDSGQEAVAAIGAASNNAPVANGAAKTVRAGNSVTGQARATDVDGDALTFTQGTDPVNGTLVLNGDGSYTYTANADAAGSDTFTFTASDGTDSSNSATVTLTVVPDFAPVASVKTLTVYEGDSGTGLKLPVFSPDNDPYDTEQVGTPGNITINSDGTFDFTAPQVSSDTTYSVGYLVKEKDANGNYTGKLAQSTVNMTVVDVPANNAPIASDVTLSAATSGTVSVSGRFSGSDLDGDALTYTKLTSPVGGTVTIDSADPKAFTVSGLSVGQYSFLYSVSDGVSEDVATVSITVHQDNRAPVVASTTRSKSVKQGAAVTIDITAFDPDGDTLSYSGTGATQGTLSNTGGVFTYTANPAAALGVDTFTLSVSDGVNSAVDVTVNVTITAANTAPIAPNDSVTLDLNGSGGATRTWTAPVFEPDGDSYSCVFNTASLPAGTTATSSGCTVSLSSSATGSGSFSYTVTDNPSAGTAASDTGTVAVDVIDSFVDTPPTAANVSATIDDQSQGTFQLAGFDRDGDAITAFAFTDANGNPPAPGTYDGATLNSSTGEVTVDGRQLSPGFYTAYYTVTAGGLTSAPATINLTVTHVLMPAAVIDTTVSPLLEFTNGSNPSVTLATGITLPLGTRDGLKLVSGRFGVNMNHQTANYSVSVLLDNAVAEFDDNGTLVNAYIPDGATAYVSATDFDGTTHQATVVNQVQSISDGVSVVGGQLVLNLQVIADKIAAQGITTDVLHRSAASGVYDVQVTANTGQSIVDLGGQLTTDTVSVTVGSQTHDVTGDTLNGSVTYSLN